MICGTYNVTLIITDTLGGVDTTNSSIDVVVYCLPVADFSIVDTGCGEVTYTPTNNSQNDVGWQWTVTPNTNVSIINPNDQQRSLSLSLRIHHKEILLYTL